MVTGMRDIRRVNRKINNAEKTLLEKNPFFGQGPGLRGLDAVDLFEEIVSVRWAGWPCVAHRPRHRALVEKKGGGDTSLPLFFVHLIIHKLHLEFSLKSDIVIP